LTAEKRKEINARRRAVWQKKLLDERNIRQRATWQNITMEKLQEKNARRRTSRQRKPEEEKNALLAKRRATAAARRNTPCAESIAIPCPNALPMINLASSKHGSPEKGGTPSPPTSPSTSTLEYTIGTNGNTPIFTPFIYGMAY
jgi:hypothetical protein